MLRKKPKKDTSIPLKGFLQFKPRRNDFQWDKTLENTVTIIVPKFKGNLGTSFCRIIRRESTFTANLDAIGSMVWEQCDGVHTVKQILSILKEQFSEKENLDQRLIQFLYQMKELGYISF